MKLDALTMIGLLLSLGFITVSCTEENNYVTPTEPDVVSIFTNGRVNGAATSISCEDDSSTIPANRAEVIEWVVRAPSGSTADSGTAAPKGEVTFSGLAAGEYTVEQTVHLDDGTEGPPKVYDGVTVG